MRRPEYGRYNLLLPKLKRAEKYMVNLSPDIFSKRLAYYLSEINALHPFREGNGRTQREFIRSLAAKNGYHVKFSNITEEEMLNASKASFLRDYSLMERLIEKTLH